MSTRRRHRRSFSLDGEAVPAGDTGQDYPSVRQLSTVPSPPKFTFGSRPSGFSMKDRAAMNPGPGSYMEGGRALDGITRYRRTPQFSFGCSTRREGRRPRQPGPGAYEYRTHMGTEGPGFSVTPRRTESARPSPRERQPGPGAHTLPSTLGAFKPKHTMTPRRNEGWVAKQLSPGPGSYAAEVEKMAGTAPQWGFGSSLQRPRDAAERADPTPGPGAYRHLDQLHGPKFSMRPRTQGNEAFVKF